MADRQTKNDKAWKTLFERYNILNRIDEKGVYSIPSKTINEVREARLMTKFDYSVNLPRIFRENGLSILPDSRSSYVIGRFECYAQLPRIDSEKVYGADLPTGRESLLNTNIYSEATALLYAQHAGLICDVLGDPADLTVLGRMSSGQFNFNITNKIPGSPAVSSTRIAVKNAQLEIDAGYESDNVFAIIEAKNQRVEGFNIRQLYYPYRLWSSRISKPVIPIFFTYSNEIFSFYIYQFEDLENYNSLSLVRSKHYQLVPTEIEVQDIRDILQNTKITPEPKNSPFPQADIFERVIDLLSQLYLRNSITQEELTTTYDFDVRQTQYYTAAARYLGLLESAQEPEQGVTYSLSKRGAHIFRMEPKARNLELAKIILSRKVFRNAMNYYLIYSRQPTKEEIIDFISEARISVGSAIAPRRAQTVRSWLTWIISLTATA